MTKIKEEYCIMCNAAAVWVRSTQFAGDHPFCDKCANQEEDFGKNDSYELWYKIKKDNRPVPVLTQEDEDFLTRITTSGAFTLEATKKVWGIKE